MNKRPQYLIVVAICSIIAAAATTIPAALLGQSGMAVWNNALYIHSTDTLSAHGDLFLFNAYVDGNGALLLIDTQSRRIVAHQSSLPHLIISNTDTVELQGDLQIRTGLTLLRGVFDTRKAHLHLSDSAFVNTSPNSQWLQSKVGNCLQPLNLLPPPHAQELISLACGPASAHHNFFAGRPQRHNRNNFSSFSQLPLSGWKRIPDPPPQLQCFFGV